MKTTNTPQIVTSEDGSHTLFNPSLNETYHSIHGAKTESLHVFIQNGLHLLEKENPVILEIGMGTGLNVLLTRQYQIQSDKLKTIEYHTLELFPIGLETVNQLNYKNALLDDEYHFFDAIHASEWDKPIDIAPDFRLQKLQKDLLSFIPDFPYDVVYFDAFAPNVQPDLWRKEIFEKLYIYLNEGGILTTYSAKGQVRRDLQEVGFKVERRPGPPGKREMLVAFKKR